MKLLKWDFLLFSRYYVIQISLVLAVLYGLSFYLLGQGLSFELFLVLFCSETMIMSIMYSGTLALLDKSQSTFSALSVIPQPIHRIYIERSLVLALIGCLGGVFLLVGYGLISSILLALPLLFLLVMACSLQGFFLGHGAQGFTDFLLRVVGLCMTYLIPFASLFWNSGHWVWWLFPGYPLIHYFKYALSGETNFLSLLLPYIQATAYLFLSVYLLKRKLENLPQS
ncbi:hypothetical protein QWY31_15240 [Cytophagales bacterium LB-30]|uniref:ABC transporter permease n=1 Tax=Shiella aurantiaca TaxID=3058365 RepID=A0ABT8F8Z7_9BACT|nr:hypothetical protein [Shiella aurantiaca]MDN4166865.1 hypothetical protein [Shiella aurantiaca]